MRLFLEAPTFYVNAPTQSNPSARRLALITDDRHRFATGEPSVKLKFGANEFEWSETRNDTGQPMVRNLNQAKGFLDYRALLEVHYLRADEKGEIDLFPLMMRSLLPYYTFPKDGKNVTFPDGLIHLQYDVRKSAPTEFRRRQKINEVLKDLATYNEALEKVVQDLGQRTSAMLAIFGEEFGVRFHFEKAERRTWPKRIEGPRILAVPAFRKLEFRDYNTVFNEARLTALALCIFFAALKESPATGLRLLVLDDVLIGLDMLNRERVMDLIRENFQDWQIIIMTYSKAWFERLKDQVKQPGWTREWGSIVLFEEWRATENSPRIGAEGSGDLLEMAEHHLKHKDFTAAAVYARKALETLSHNTCAKATLFVLHVGSAKDRKLEHYLTALEARLGELADAARRRKALELIARLVQARQFVLNRNAHFDADDEDTLSGEVGAAIETVKAFKAFLSDQSWENVNFQTRLTLSPLEQMNAQIAAARTLAAKPAPRQCQQAMHQAHELFWLLYGTKLGVELPLGVEPTAPIIWRAARTTGKLSPLAEAKLNAAKAYLFGSVAVQDFDPLKFEQTAKLLEELSA